MTKVAERIVECFFPIQGPFVLWDWVSTAGIDVKCIDFEESSKIQNGSSLMNVTKPSLIWAAVTVGAPSYYAVLQSVFDSIALALHKAFAVLSASTIDNNHLVLHPHYENLDQTEKAVLSYYLGMTMCKLVADHSLNVPWLEHARHLKAAKKLKVTPPNTRSLPDLIGKDANKDWHILEAKCRYARSVSTTERDNWKRQVQTVSEVSNKPPKTHSYCLTLQLPRYAAELVDPKPKEDGDSVKIEIDGDDFIREYYAPFLEAMSDIPIEDHESPHPVFGPMFQHSASGYYIEIGIVPRVLNQLRHGAAHEVSPVDIVSYDNIYIGSDGIAVRVLGGEGT